MAEEKKSFFKKIGDALSNRDEKEAAAKTAADAAAKAAAEAKAKVEAEAAKLKAEAEAKKNAILATHVVASGETLSHIALKHYGHATPPYYKLIYEFNKDVIGDNINIIVPGQELRIPVLPEELK